MKFSPKVKRKIQNLFVQKCIELQSSSKKPYGITGIWMEYLARIECRRTHKLNFSEKDNFIFIKDPLYYGNYIRINKDLAEKFIVLGLP